MNSRYLLPLSGKPRPVARRLDRKIRTRCRNISEFAVDGAYSPRRLDHTLGRAEEKEGGTGSDCFLRHISSGVGLAGESYGERINSGVAADIVSPLANRLKEERGRPSFESVQDRGSH